MAFSRYIGQVLDTSTHFTSHSCLAQLTDFLLSGMDKGMHTDMIFIELQTAFDTLDDMTRIQNISKKITITGPRIP